MLDVIVAGLDLSMTGTGLARLWCAPGLTPNAEVSTFKTKAPPKDRAMWLPDRHVRLSSIVARCEEWCRGVSLVVVEGPSMGSHGGSAHDRSGLWWLVVAALRDAGRTVAEVPPSSRVIYATGSGRSDKDEVLAAVVRRYPDVAVSNNNEADALVLALMGARHLGRPVEGSLPATHTRAMEKIRW